MHDQVLELCSTKGYNTAHNGAWKSPQKCMGNCQDIDYWSECNSSPVGVQLVLVRLIVRNNIFDSET